MTPTRNLQSAVGAGIVALALLAGGDRISSKGISPIDAGPAGLPADIAGVPAQQWPEVVINGSALSRGQILQLLAIYGRVLPGRFWYDPVSGLWGREGREVSGYVQPGLPLGPLSPRASRGTTGIFINGREINMVEARFYQWVLGRVIPGRYWLDGRTGNVGLERNPMPLFNLVMAIRAAQPQGQQGPGFWPSGVNGPDGMVGASSGNCTIVSTDSGSVATPGCD